MKIAVISDVHSNLLSLNLAIRDAMSENVDSFIFLGDYITDGDNGNDIIDIIKEKANYAILGNREKYIINYSPKKKDYNNYKPIDYTYHSLSNDSINYINSLNDFKIIEINNYKILMIHGDLYPNLLDNYKQDFDLLIDKYDFDICLFGHTHNYFCKNYKNRLFLNPGSIGQPSDTPFYKYCIIEIKDKYKISLRKFRTSETFEKLKNSYINTRFYKENYIWANLILMGIKQGRDFCVPFIKLLNTRLEKYDDIDVEIFNKIWEETYREYLNYIIK